MQAVPEVAAPAGVRAAAAAAGSSPVCPDADGDGQTTCNGDCNDADPNDFAGNPEVCGDGQDNNCNPQIDEICQGLGAFVSDSIGDDSNPGTQKLPVQTIAQGMSNAAKIGGGVAVYGPGQYEIRAVRVRSWTKDSAPRNPD